MPLVLEVLKTLIDSDLGVLEQLRVESPCHSVGLAKTAMLSS